MAIIPYCVSRSVLFWHHFRRPYTYGVPEGTHTHTRTHARTHARTHTHTHTSLTDLFPGLPRWAGTRKVNQSGFYWSKRPWAAVASAEPYASLHLAPNRHHASTPPLSFFTGRMPFLPPNQQRQSTEGCLCKKFISCARYIYLVVCMSLRRLRTYACNQLSLSFCPACYQCAFFSVLFVDIYSYV